jgi:predicted GNAT family N-acyltransferase
MDLRRITVEDPAYAEEKDLRDRTLRRPLGMVLSAKDIQDDCRRIHLVAFDPAGRLVGCVQVEREGDAARIRQMAVDEASRGTGTGRELMEGIERIAAQEGCRRVTMHARCVAQGFYERLGYATVSGVFQEVGIPHVIMEKDLPAEGARL